MYFMKTLAVSDKGQRLHLSILGDCIRQIRLLQLYLPILPARALDKRDGGRSVSNLSEGMLAKAADHTAYSVASAFVFCPQARMHHQSRHLLYSCIAD